jgi:class 3 adenylate cyclase
VAAVRAALAAQAAQAGSELTRSLRLRAAIHRGPAMAATLNEHLDYFGTTVNAAVQLPQVARGGELVLTTAVATDPQVTALLRTRRLTSEISTVTVPGLKDRVLQRIPLPAGT